MIIAVDVGGTKTLVASFLADKSTAKSASVEQPSEGHSIARETRFVTSQDAGTFLSDLLPVLRQHAKGHTVRAISLAAPGIIDRHSGSISRCGNLPWRNVAVRKVLSEHFDCPIYVDNDANLAGLAEARALSPTPKLSLYLTVSTGIGSGLAVNGKLLAALGGSEAGHMMLRHHSEHSATEAGRSHTTHSGHSAAQLAQSNRDKHFMEWEDYASGRALRDRTGKLASDITDKRIWHDIAERVADGLLALIPALQPSIIIIGGGVGTHFDAHWRDDLEAILTKRLTDYIEIPPIVQAQHAEEAVLYGCYYYAEDRLAD